MDYPLFQLSDYQAYTDDERDFNFQVVYDLAWQLLVRFCPSLASLDLASDDTSQLPFLKKAIMLQMYWLINNKDNLSSAGNLVSFNIGDYSETYQFPDGVSYYNSNAIGLLLSYFNCSRWLTRQVCGCPCGGNCGTS